LAAAHVHPLHVDAGAKHQIGPGEDDDETEAPEHDGAVMAQHTREQISAHWRAWQGRCVRSAILC
jgi:hypothetical protein